MKLSEHTAHKQIKQLDCSSDFFSLSVASWNLVIELTLYKVQKAAHTDQQ